MLQPTVAAENWLTPESWPPPLAEVERACLGDQQAAESIYRAAQPRLEAFLRYHGFDAPTREDISADVSEVVLTKIGTLRKPGTFESWFWTIARNNVNGWLRRKQRDAKRIDLVSPQPTPPDETLVVREEHIAIRIALDTLTTTDRHLLWLREVEGLSYRDISGRLNIAAGAVRVRSHRARQRLASAFEKVAEQGN